MGLKTKVKSYSFWVSLASAVILIMKLVGQKFGFDVDESLISDLFTSLCAILVILGIIVVPSSVVVDSNNSKSIQVEEKMAVTENIVKENEIKTVCDEKNDQQIQLEPTVVKIVDVVEPDSFYTENKEVENEIKFENIKEHDEINLHFDVQSFIDKVCTKREEFNSNILNFVEFLQNEINIIKDKE